MPKYILWASVSILMLLNRAAEHKIYKVLPECTPHQLSSTCIACQWGICYIL